MDATDSMSRRGLEGAETTADPGTGDVLEPNLPLRGILRKCVEPQFSVPMRVVVAARNTAGESRHFRSKVRLSN